MQKLQKNGITIELALFPYMWEPAARKTWMNVMGVSNPLDAVMIFMKQWNTLLSTSGFTNKFIGIVFDYEERKQGWLVAPVIDIDAATVARLKKTYGAFELGVTIGWDDVSKFTALPHVDKWYTQMYDFYNSGGVLALNAKSPFNTYVNDPAGLTTFLMTKVFSASMLQAYQANSKKIMAMWSLQNPICLGVLDSRCGSNWEFGLWTGAAFNGFIQKIKAVAPALASVQHGLYHFSYTPKSWVPS
jgi:hypothetical protein